MRRAEMLQEVRKIRFEEIHGSWTESVKGMDLEKPYTPPKKQEQTRSADMGQDVKNIEPTKGDDKTEVSKNAGGNKVDKT